MQSLIWLQKSEDKEIMYLHVYGYGYVYVYAYFFFSTSLFSSAEHVWQPGFFSVYFKVCSGHL